MDDAEGSMAVAKHVLRDDRVSFVPAGGLSSSGHWRLEKGVTEGDEPQFQQLGVFMLHGFVLQTLHTSGWHHVSAATHGEPTLASVPAVFLLGVDPSLDSLRAKDEDI